MRPVDVQLSLTKYHKVGMFENCIPKNAGAFPRDQWFDEESVIVLSITCELNCNEAFSRISSNYHNMKVMFNTIVNYYITELLS